MKADQTCWLCGRPLGTIVQHHHPLPRSLKGRATVPVHPICHRKIHEVFHRKELKDKWTRAEELRQHPEIETFLKWIATKHPDFYKPTRSKTKKRF